MKHILYIVAIVALISCNSKAQETSKKETQTYTVVKSESEWKELLSPHEFNVLREAGTERPFTSTLNKEYKAGTLVCAACYAPVYNNLNKFDSGTGWPSYDQAIEGQVERDVDYKIGYARTELKCNTCGSHLGHEFNDGPRKTTGMRHCINGVALNFVPEGEELPAIRK